MLKSWTVVLIAIVAAVKSDDECRPLEAVQCIQSYQPPDLDVLEESFPDAEFLNQNCRPSITVLECLVNVAQNCPDLTAVMEPQPSVLNKLLEFLHAVCDDDSQLRKDYLENVECYNRALPKMDECEEIQNTVDQFFESVANDTDPEEMIEPLCLSHELIFQCAVDEAETECGTQQRAPLEIILDGLSGIYIEAACPEEKLRQWQALYLLDMLADEMNELK